MLRSVVGCRSEFSPRFGLTRGAQDSGERRGMCHRAPGVPHASPATLSLMPGKSTLGYAYNGHVPGPTLEVREGDHVIVHFWNQLPEPTTIHWHGIHLPAEMDGSPLDPVLPGARYDYVFTIQPGQ